MLVPRFIVACDFLIFADIWGLFCECHYIHTHMVNLHTEERASKTNFDWPFCWMSINQKSGWQTFRRRIVSGQKLIRSWFKSLWVSDQALFFVSPFPPECFTERNENRAWSQVTSRFVVISQLNLELYFSLENRMLLKRGMGNGEWGMGNGEWGMGNGEWEIVVSGNT